MKLNSDGITLRNGHSVKPFKAQLALYNLAVGEMQGYLPDNSYILGNGWVLNKTVNKRKIIRKSSNPFDKLGIIQYKNKDSEYVTKSLDGVKWLRQLNDSTDWTHDPPSNNYIYPNMNNKMDGMYHRVKTQISDKYGEITSIYNCGIQNRNNGFNKKI